jgi:hypothetical protein
MKRGEFKRARRIENPPQVANLPYVAVRASDRQTAFSGRLLAEGGEHETK